ncbi:unnamed protein product [Ambrosiozyma monospora]|uniref:Unnamed protein product n=1 Tax=Ambrosiozyma monospora TaxID=43982 RepID=A0A9W6YZ21_AMBMO|nr:unnamed protein product [Ambrosiozyma monospora]
MVRLKSRYILFEILYPDTLSSPTSLNFTTQSQAILSLHQPSNPTITPKSLVQLIRLSLAKNFGTLGSSTSIPLSLKYFSHQTSTGIIRINQENVRLLLASLFFITSIGGQNCIFNVVCVSGSIKQCENKSSARSRLLMRNVQASDGEAVGTDVLNALFDGGIKVPGGRSGDDEGDGMDGVL